METVSVATTMLPKNSPNTRTDNGVASTTAPARRWVAWEMASRRNSSLCPVPARDRLVALRTIGHGRSSGCDQVTIFSIAPQRARSGRREQG